MKERDTWSSPAQLPVISEDLYKKNPPSIVYERGKRERFRSLQMLWMYLRMKLKPSTKERGEVHSKNNLMFIWHAVFSIYIMNFKNHTTPFALAAEARASRSYGQS